MSKLTVFVQVKTLIILSLCNIKLRDQHKYYRKDASANNKFLIHKVQDKIVDYTGCRV